MLNVLALPCTLVGAAIGIAEPVLVLGLIPLFRFTKGVTHFGNFGPDRRFEGHVDYVGESCVRRSAGIRVSASNRREAGRLVMEQFFRDHYDLDRLGCDLLPSTLEEL